MSAFQDSSLEELLRLALTGADDRNDSTAALAMTAVSSDLDCLWTALGTEDAQDYDFGDVLQRISTRAEIAAELARRELAAAKGKTMDGASLQLVGGTEIHDAPQ